MRWVWLGILVILGGCAKRPSQATEAPAADTDSLEGLSAIQAMGDSLTTARQQLLLERLLAVAQKEGWAGAVRYCHQAAETLTFVDRGVYYMQRLAAKNRNPKSRFRDTVDESVFNYFASTQTKAPVLRSLPTGWRYYRPIYIMMPTCLKCHGQPADLDGPALAEIRRRYPGDKATGFTLGELRGLWVLESRAP